MTRAPVVEFLAGFAAGLAVLVASDGNPVAYAACLVTIAIVGVTLEARRSR